MSHLDTMASNIASQFAMLEAWAIRGEAARKELERIQKEQARRQREAEVKQAEFNRELRREKEKRRQ